VCLRARAAFEQGRGQDAAADLAALIVMARHLGQNGTMMECLVQFAFEIKAIEVAAAYLPRQNAATIRDLAARLDRLPAPTTLQETMRHEKEFLLRWMRPRLEKKDRESAYQELRESLTEEQAQALVKSAGGEVAALLKLTDETAERYDEVGRILVLPADAFPAAWAAFQKKYESARPYATSVLRTAEGLRYASLRVQALFAMLRT